jgi:aspartate racemase
VFDRVQARSSLPLRSIVEATRSEAERLRVRRLGLLGTRFTMRSDFYARAFAPGGMEILVPEEVEQELIHHRLMTEIELGIVKDSTRQELLAIVKRLVYERGIDAVVLGCAGCRSSSTGASTASRSSTTAIHVEDIVRHACSERRAAAEARRLTIDDQERAIVRDVCRLRSHPLVPAYIPIHGYVYDVSTGRLREVAAATKAGQPT